MAAPQVRIGAYEAGSWNGITFITDDRASFQLRVGVQAEFGDYLDGDIGTPTALEQDGNEIFHADAAVTVRRFERAATGCRFSLKTRPGATPVTVTLRLPNGI